MHEETNLGKEILSGLLKSWGWLFSILFAYLGKVGIILMMKQKYTMPEWIGMFFVSIFSGYTAIIMCDAYNWVVLSKWLPQIMTIFGQQIAVWVMSDYKRILNGLLNIFLKGKK